MNKSEAFIFEYLKPRGCKGDNRAPPVLEALFSSNEIKWQGGGAEDQKSFLKTSQRLKLKVTSVFF